MLEISACCMCTVPQSLTALCGQAWPFLDEDYSEFISVRPVHKLKRHAVINGGKFRKEMKRLGRKLDH